MSYSEEFAARFESLIQSAKSGNDITISNRNFKRKNNTENAFSKALHEHLKSTPQSKNSMCDCGSGLKYKRCCFNKKLFFGKEAGA